MAYQDFYYEWISNYLGVSLTVAIIIALVIAIWTIIWKGIALWKAAGKKQLYWFIILLILNTLGILEILYIYVFSKMDLKKKQSVKIKKLKKKR